MRRKGEFIKAPTNTLSSAPEKVGIPIFPAFEPIDVFGPIETFQTLSRSRKLDLYLISSNKTSLDPVSTAAQSAAMNAANSSFFPAVVATRAIDNVPDDIEVLLVPGGLGTRNPDMAATGGPIDFIAATYPKLHSLISVCTRGGLVARTGLLDGKRATTNKVSWNSTTALGPNVLWDKKARWVQDGNVWSSGGVSADIDVTLGWIASVFGEGVTRDTANKMEYEWRNDPRIGIISCMSASRQGRR